MTEDILQYLEDVIQDVETLARKGQIDNILLRINSAKKYVLVQQNQLHKRSRKTDDMEFAIKQEYCPKGITTKNDHITLRNFRDVDIIKHEEENFIDVIVSDQHRAVEVNGQTIVESLYVEDDEEYEDDEYDEEAEQSA